MGECLAAPTGLLASLESVPTAGWLQIMLFCCMQETGAGEESSFFSLAKYEGYPNVGDAEAGDIAGIPWVRYDDPETKTFKLNAERQNGRAAMMGITGCLLHELLGVDPLYPTGGLGGAAPPTIFYAVPSKIRPSRVTDSGARLGQWSGVRAAAGS